MQQINNRHLLLRRAPLQYLFTPHRRRFPRSLQRPFSPCPSRKKSCDPLLLQHPLLRLHTHPPLPQPQPQLSPPPQPLLNLQPAPLHRPAPQVARVRAEVPAEPWVEPALGMPPPLEEVVAAAVTTTPMAQWVITILLLLMVCFTRTLKS